MVLPPPRKYLQSVCIDARVNTSVRKRCELALAGSDYIIEANVNWLINRNYY